jgi:tRNA dimethylallyltransferase
LSENRSVFPPLVVVIGPTAVGKTAAAIDLCRSFDGEVVSADSRQIYRGMDIGTAKPSQQEMSQAVHHLIDIVDPDRTLTLAEYQEMAYAAIEDVQDRGRVPFLVGGTGQWVQAVIKGWRVPRVPPDHDLRAELQAEADRIGSEAFHTRLAAVDPDCAAKIDHRNVRRVIRGLEVYLKTGIPISRQQGAQSPAYRVLQLGLTLPRDLLYDRIDARIERMMSNGLLAEVEHLVERGYGFDLPAMSGLGYRQLGLHLSGDVDLAEAVALIKKETRRFVRQQYNWFRLNDPDIHWFDLSQSSVEELVGLVEGFLA